MPGAWLPEVSVYQRHMELEPGVYIFVLETKNRIRSNKFTIVKQENQVEFVVLLIILIVATLTMRGLVTLSEWQRKRK